MLPRTAMPSAPPSSAPVSEIPDAEPARSGGAVLTMRSVPSVTAGATPSARTTEAITRTASDEPPSTVASRPRPTAASTRPPPITYAGRAQRTASGASIEPAMKPPDDGDEDPERVRGQRGAEGRQAAELDVDQRVGQPPLPTDEERAEDEAGEDR